jgi:hypothetical protein
LLLLRKSAGLRLSNILMPLTVGLTSFALLHTGKPLPRQVIRDGPKASPTKCGTKITSFAGTVTTTLLL